MSYLTEWHLHNRKMQIGDVIVQQVFIPPTPVFSQKIVFGVRISEIIDEPNRKGFSYETLEGHVEKGLSTFTIERTDKGNVFQITTYSKPGNIIARLLGPIFTKPYQKFSTKKAMKNIQAQFNREAQP